MKRKVTSKGKQAAKAFEGVMGQERMADITADVFRRGKVALDSVVWEMGQLLVESIMYMEREELAGPDYAPSDPSISKGGTQAGSVYVGDRKLRVRHPRLVCSRHQAPAFRQQLRRVQEAIHRAL